METYKKGDYIAIITNEPMVHFIEMFGDGLDTDDVEEQKYIARIKNVIDAGNYFVYIPSAGYRCIINSSEILRKVSEEELTDDDKDDEIDNFFSITPRFVYINEDKDIPGENNKEKCESLARKAMSELFPENIVVSCKFDESDYIKEDLLSKIDSLIERENFENKQFLESIRKKRNHFKKMLQHLRFKEYYEVQIGIQDELNKNATNFHLVAVDTNFEEVVIAKGMEERTIFYRSLGPEYDSINNYYRDLSMEILTKEVIIKL